MNVRGKNRGKEKRGVRRAGLGRLALREAVDGRWIQESAPATRGNYSEP